MPKKLDPAVGEILKGFGFGSDAVWDCHGTWVVYHRVLEQIAAKAGIGFDMPLPLETNGAAKTVAICVCGRMAGKSEWSIGEAAPGNNKNSYPYAMAEKRAKDRVVLKLIGLHGLLYSEEEADAFTEEPQRASSMGEKKKVNGRGETVWEQFNHELDECETALRVEKMRAEYIANVYPTWPKAWPATAETAFMNKLVEFSSGDILAETLRDSVDSETGEITEVPSMASPSPSEPQTRTEYIQAWHDTVVTANDSVALIRAWNADKHARIRFGLSQDEFDDLKDRVMAKAEALKIKAKAGA